MVDKSTLNFTVILHGTTQTRCMIVPKANGNALDNVSCHESFVRSNFWPLNIDVFQIHTCAALSFDFWVSSRPWYMVPVYINNVHTYTVFTRFWRLIYIFFIYSCNILLFLVCIFISVTVQGFVEQLRKLLLLFVDFAKRNLSNKKRKNFFNPTRKNGRCTILLFFFFISFSPLDHLPFPIELSTWSIVFSIVWSLSFPPDEWIEEEK